MYNKQHRGRFILLENKDGMHILAYDMPVSDTEIKRESIKFPKSMFDELKQLIDNVTNHERLSN